MIKGKIKFFELDFFNSHQMIAELDTGETIHGYHNGSANVIDIYKGNEIIFHRVIHSSRYEYVHLCRGYLRIKFLALMPEKNQYVTLTATIPHDVGKTCTVI